MTIEQKAKAYDWAIKKAKESVSNGYVSQNFVFDIFPELKENREEKIRKELISFFTERAKYTEDSTFNGLSNKAIIAWLAKQGEQKHAWSEEDDKMLNKAITLLNEFGGDRDAGAYTLQEMDCRNCADWLKSIKDRVQPWQELTQDDKQYLLICKNALRKYEISDKWDAGIISRWLENKLKIPQNRWKPSEEQMKALKIACDEHWEPDGLDYLYTLFQDLQKLKE